MICVCWRRANAVRITAASTSATDFRTEFTAAVANSRLGAVCFRGMKLDVVVLTARPDNLRARVGRSTAAELAHTAGAEPSFYPRIYPHI